MVDWTQLTLEQKRKLAVEMKRKSINQILKDISDGKFKKVSDPKAVPVVPAPSVSDPGGGSGFGD